MYHKFISKTCTFTLHVPSSGFDWMLKQACCCCAGGLVQVTSFAVLPSVTPAACLVLALLAMLPCLLTLWRQPHPRLFLPAIYYAALCSFMFGYHVHEKAILTVTIPGALILLHRNHHRSDASTYFMLSTTGHVALMPLLFTAPEYPIKVCEHATQHCC